MPVSLVIPVRNEAATFADLLASIDSQTFRPREIVEIGSADDSLHGVAHKHLIVLLLVLVAVMHSKFWILALPPAALARAAKAIWTYEEKRRVAWLLNPARMMLVATILGVIDFATFVGWGQGIWHRTKNA